VVSSFYPLSPETGRLLGSAAAKSCLAAVTSPKRPRYQCEWALLAWKHFMPLFLDGFPRWCRCGLTLAFRISPLGPSLFPMHRNIILCRIFFFGGRREKTKPNRSPSFQAPGGFGHVASTFPFSAFLLTLLKGRGTSGANPRTWRRHLSHIPTSGPEEFFFACEMPS